MLAHTTGKKQFIVQFSILLKHYDFSWKLNSFKRQGGTLFIIFQKLHLRLRHISPWALVTAGFRFSNENWRRWNPIVRKPVPMIRLGLTKDTSVQTSTCHLCKISSKASKYCWECSNFTLQTILTQFSAESGWNLMLCNRKISIVVCHTHLSVSL